MGVNEMKKIRNLKNGKIISKRFGRAVLWIVLSALASASTAPTRIKLDTVPDQYMPTTIASWQPVSMQDFHFQVNPETLRARIVVDYTYPNEPIFGKNDSKGGPQPTIVQIPGLSYDAAEHLVVFESQGKRTVCAGVEERKGIFGRHLKIHNTDACTVKAEDAKHVEDDGWRIRRFLAIDTYFEVRS